MNEYYGSTLASSDFFAHYGVKGMKWGVRKAIATGNKKALARQYRKASKKLKKLQNKANRDLQTQNAKKYAKAAAGHLVGLAGGVGGRIAGEKASSHFLNKVRENENWMNKIENTLGSAYKKAKKNPLIPADTVAKLGNDYRHWTSVAKSARDKAKSNAALSKQWKAVSTGVALGGAAVSGFYGAKALKARYNASNKGHAKAVAKRNEFEREMKSAFKGTQYGASRRKTSKKRG